MSKLITPGLFISLLVALVILLLIGLIACYLDRGWLSIESAADLAQIFGSLAVVFSLLFIARQLGQQAVQLQQQAVQLRLQTQLARGSNSQSFVNASSSFVLAIGCNPRLMKLYANSGEKFDSLSDDEKKQYSYLVSWWLTFYENVVYQNGIGLLDEGVYDAWMSDMKGFIQRRRVERVWNDLRGNYSDEFQKIFQPLIDAREKTVLASRSADPSPQK